MKKEVNGLEVYNKIMDAALKLPGAKVNREVFLRKELKPYVREEMIDRAVDTSVFEAGIYEGILNKIAHSVLRYHTWMASGASFLDGLPGGFAILAMIPADVAQFYYNAIILAQKLAYIYGWPDLSGDITNDDLKIEIALFMGVMMGNATAVTAVKQLADALAKGISERLPRVALTKYAIYNTIKQVARWVGVEITKDSFAKGISKVVPIVGGFVSGGLTLGMMTTMGNRLIKHLKANPFKPDVSKDTILV